MKTRSVIAGLFVAAAVSLGFGQEPSVNRITVPLSDPARPAMLKIGFTTGSISVKAYNGKDVIVELTQKMERETERKERNGLRLIPNTSAGLTIEEEDNVVSVGSGYRSMNTEKILIVQVPVKTSVKLSTINDGDINVEGIEGEIEVTNTNGSVFLKDVSGFAVAHALNGDIKASFKAVTPNKAMSFSSLNGTIDVTFPPSIKATLNLKSEQGEIYTDFDVLMEKTAPKIEEEGRGKRRRVVIEKTMRGTINGGGAEMLFKNFNGDIIIRKAK